MPTVQRTCKITGKTFFVSEQEQLLRQKFGVPLPDTHSYERIRHLMTFRNIYTLYNDQCGRCGKHTLSMWGENPTFPIYCKECWFSDNWKPVEMELDFERSFFDQFQELVKKSPHNARGVTDPMENSEYCNGASHLRNCYMVFDADDGENCYYGYGIRKMKDSVDVTMTDDAQLLYECLSCHHSYKVFWSEFSTHCMDSYFLYDCNDCQHCAFSVGLRHKQYVFMNQQLTPEEYQQRINTIFNGSFESLQQYRKKFLAMKRQYSKKFLIGSRNEQVSGNIISNSKNVEDGYIVDDAENCINVCDVHGMKDSLDIVCFGLEAERCLSSTSVGINVSDVRYSFACVDHCYSIEYCGFVYNSHDCFGCAFGQKMEYRILNKPYTASEYKKIVARLKQTMMEREEYGVMFPPHITPHAYNESIAQLHLPLSKNEAEKRGYCWVEKKIPQVPQEELYTHTDNIHDVEWNDIDGKLLVCEVSQRPFKIIKQEFYFYKRFNIPLPRLHPEVRLFKRYPRDLMLNLHEAACAACHKKLQTSMDSADNVLCERCYQEGMNE